MSSPTSMTNTHSAMPKITLQGSALERGRWYGQHAEVRIQHSLNAYRKMFATCDINWSTAQSLALPCMEVAFRLFPHLEDEFTGLSEGSGVDFDSLAALNCRTEILPPDYLTRATGLTADQLPNNGHLTECTSFAFRNSSQPGWLAQNWDWIGSQREALVLLESYPQSGPAHLSVTEAGMLAKIGLNEYGFGITLNILRSVQDRKNTGMPIHLFLRGLLECKNVEEALDLTAKTRFAGSSNIMISDAGGAIASIEAAPSGARILKPSTGAQSAHLCHTNHFLHTDLAGEDAGLTGNLSTEGRLQKAQQMITSTANLEDIQTLLRDTSDGLQSICRFPDTSLPSEAQVETVVAVAMNLHDCKLWLTAAQPSTTDFTGHSLNRNRLTR